MTLVAILAGLAFIAGLATLVGVTFGWGRVLVEYLGDALFRAAEKITNLGAGALHTIADCADALFGAFNGVGAELVAGFFSR